MMEMSCISPNLLNLFNKFTSYVEHDAFDSSMLNSNPNAIFQLILEEINFYSTMTTGSSVNTTPDEIESFVCIEILKGVVKPPSMDDLRFASILDTMPVK
ncbi:hypothetical protein HHI36_014425 [Cryptolaemus montrouzieri]|uniref:Uncharacterized protein n=1 Tax=Cryptolaemus montrouzieri TaxID=559131 RepID=A0ABD2N2N5_9CUCU